MGETHGNDLVQVVALLAAGVIAVPIFRRLGLGSVLGYLVAGVVIGPFGLGLFSRPGAILNVAELGVVMFLFVIGLEMQPSRLWGLRRQIFGLGAAQVIVCGLLLTGTGMAIGLSATAAFIVAAGFTLSSTAIVMQLLEERGDTSTEQANRIVSILLLEDLAIVPLLALVAFLAPGSENIGATERLSAIAVALASVAALVLAGRYLLNPMFRILAESHAREVMTAAALLVVLGAALAMQLGGLSMALGAFLAGVLLSESAFRHQLEADIEPFRGILLGLFFLGVGMSLDLAVIAREWPLILLAVAAYMLVKMSGIYGVARLLKAKHAEATTRAAMLAQGGEFAFVLLASAASVRLIDAETNAVATATVIISMALTPLLVQSLRWLLPKDELSLDGVDVADGLHGRVLIIGFGRFGQVVSQPLLLRGVDVSIIDNDVEMIRAAARFGFKVYYGDGTRIDILRAAGADDAEAVLICVNDAETAVRIAGLVKSEFPLAKLLARAYDRRNAMGLIAAGVDYQIRETMESALLFGKKALVKLGLDADEAAEIIDDVRRRDSARLDAQLVGGLSAGRDYMASNMPVPTPLSPPKKAGSALNEETAGVIANAEIKRHDLTG